MAPAVNALSVDVEEYYHGIEFSQSLGPGVSRLPSRVVGQTERLLDLLDEHGARGTFFVLGVVASRFPRLIQAITRRGHEVACHGWDHTPLWALDAAGFRQDVRWARRAAEDAAGGPVVGYRAPNYSLRPDMAWVFPTLEEEGYLYDSSIHPIAHDRYGHPDAPRFPYRVPGRAGGGLWEVPVGTARVGGRNVPLGGGFFRLFPLALLRGGIARINRVDGRPCLLYVHPWEFDPRQPRVEMPWAHRFRHYVGLRAAEAKLRALLREFTFTSIRSAFPEVQPAPTVLAAAS